MAKKLSAASAEFSPGFGPGSNGNDSQADKNAAFAKRLRTAIKKKAEGLATTRYVKDLGLVPPQGPLEEGGFPMTM